MGSSEDGELRSRRIQLRRLFSQEKSTAIPERLTDAMVIIKAELSKESDKPRAEESSLEELSRELSKNLLSDNTLKRLLQ